MSLSDGTGPGTHDVMVGHGPAIAGFEAAVRSGKLHHGWLITGPEGIGKATLAFRLARYLISGVASDGSALVGASRGVLDHTMQEATARKIAGEAHPNLLVLERGMDASGNRRKTELTVDVIRKLNSFFGTTAGEGGWRVAIVDSADEMNASAANALLKNLEEPPANTILLLISHRPGRLLPTIRSRCRVLPLKPLSERQVVEVVQALPDSMANPDEIRQAAALSGGAPGRALALLDGGGLDLATALKAILAAPLPDWSNIHPLAASFQTRDAEAKFQLLVSVWRDEISDAVRRAIAAGQLNQAHDMTLFSERFGQSMDETLGLNLDKRQFLLNAFDDWYRTTPSKAMNG
ncbi:MAG: DNA polymerase III subunit delta' [Pseudomonadota bacterium]